MYLGITESETLPHHCMFIHLAIVSLDGECHAMPPITAGYPLSVLYMQLSHLL